MTEFFVAISIALAITASLRVRDGRRQTSLLWGWVIACQFHDGGNLASCGSTNDSPLPSVTPDVVFDTPGCLVDALWIFSLEGVRVIVCIEAGSLSARLAWELMLEMFVSGFDSWSLILGMALLFNVLVPALSIECSVDALALAHFTGILFANRGPFLILLERWPTTLEN